MTGPIGLPPSLLPGQPPPLPGGPPVAFLEISPDLLAALIAAAGQSGLTGTVAAAPESGLAVLLTPLGPLPIASRTPLPPGAQVTIQPLAGRPGLVAILAVDGSPTPGAPAIAGEPLQAAAPPEPAPPAVVDLGAHIVAIVVGPIPPETAIPATPASPPAPGTEAPPSPAPEAAPRAAPSGEAKATPKNAVAGPPAGFPGPTKAPQRAATVIPASGLPPPSETARAGATTAPAARSPAAARGIADRPLAAAAPSFPAGTRLVLRVLGLQPPPAADLPLPPAIAGTLRRAAGGAVVETAAGSLRLTPEPPLVSGTPVLLRLLSGQPARAVLILPEPREASTTAPAEPAAAPRSPEAAAPEPSAPPMISAPAESPDHAAPKPPAARIVTTSQSDAEPTIHDLAILAEASAPDAAASRAGGAPPPAARLLVGTVLAAAGAPAAASLVATPLGVLAVTPPLAAVPGTLLLLAALDPPGLFDPLPGPAAAPARAEHGWPTLQAALTTLTHAAPDLAAQLRADFSGASGERLAAAFLYLLAAVRGGGRVAWPGEAVEHALAAAGRQDIVRQLGEDLGELRRLAASPATAPWQVFILPVVDGTALREVRLYLKRPGGRGSRGPRSAEENARFVLEFELSRFGALQLDGFIRRRRFDLALRSRAPLGPVLEGEIARIFHDRIAAAGLTGTIEFPVSPSFPVAPLDALRERVGMAV